MDVQARFWGHVDKSTECWTWTASRDRYGVFAVGGKRVKAHRFSWELASGRSVPEGMSVLHRCDNPPCVNPDHLFLGTQADNVRDCARKGRLVPPTCPPGKKARGDQNGVRKHPEVVRGENNGNSKLSDAQRVEISRRVVSTRAAVLANEYGVSVSTIFRAVRYCRRSLAA